MTFSVRVSVSSELDLSPAQAQSFAGLPPRPRKRRIGHACVSMNGFRRLSHDFSSREFRPL